MNRLFGLFGIFAALAILAYIGCSRQAYYESLRPEMISAQDAMRELNSYAWDQDAFNETSNEKEILRVLDHLIHDFHQVDRHISSESLEPGFRAALANQQEQLVGIKDSFVHGDKPRANQQIRRMTNNCIACHSRMNVPTDFFGAPPPVARQSIENRFAAGQYLFATRQFDKASAELLRVAELLPSGQPNSTYALEALKLWLVIQVRVKSNFADAAKALSKFEQRIEVTEDYASLVNQWIADLETMAVLERPGQGLLQEAASLLGPNIVDRSFEEDEMQLVRTLRATNILHTILRGLPPEHLRREATFSLALASDHLPVDALDQLRLRYLEQTIFDFPGTSEAKQSFALYLKQLELIHGSDSQGIALTPEAQSYVAELKQLANQT